MVKTGQSASTAGGPADPATPVTPVAPVAPLDGPAALLAPVDFEPRGHLPFPVVGIGASAGGLRALQAFFDGTAPDAGMAYVVIQHLPPDHDSMLASILARHTAMPVVDIVEGTAVEIDHVYVTRPSHTPLLAGGRFHLGEPTSRRGHRCPVDDFFRALATEQKERSIAIVLSGMGSNGTAGSQAVKAAGGLCLAQDPDTADYPGMPTSLIRAGYADRVLRTDEMGALLQRFVRHGYLDPEAVEGSKQGIQDDPRHLRELLAILRTRTGHDFTGYKKPTVLRRTQRRMGLAGLTSLREYANLLRESPEEPVALANDLLISVTGFFRDPEAWRALQESVIAPLVESKPPGAPLRAWVSACASGEEPYSLAMLIAEEMARTGKQLDVKIFATDTADRSLALARAGVYPDGIEGDITLERLDRFFDSVDHVYRIKKEIRDMVVFATQDLLVDPPFSRLDLCTCRNLLIYLEPPVQDRVLSLLHFSLREGGVLFLGTAETPGVVEELFEVVSKRWRIYRRSGAANLPSIERALPPRPGAKVHVALPGALPTSTPPASIAMPVQRALLEQFGPPTVVIDAQDRVVYYHGDSSTFLMQSGEPTRGLYDMLRAGLRPIVRSAVRQALADRRAVTVSSGPTETPEGVARVHVTAAPLAAVPGVEHVRVSFDARLESGSGPAPVGGLLPVALVPPAWAVTDAAVGELEAELRTVRRELQQTVAAFEATHEDLKASNEEVTSINEELQSANEELETSKEELQSLNEELRTVNGQLQEKVAELESATDDLSNLLGSTDIAVLFLGTDLRVRRFTPALNDLLELIPSDIGRPVMHLARKFDDGDLVGIAREVLERFAPIESEIRSHSGRWYLQRALPYRTADNRIDGIVLAFVDVTARKQAELAVEAAQARLQAVIEQMPAGVLVIDAPSARLLLGNRRAADLLGRGYPLPSVGAHWTAAFTDVDAARDADSEIKAVDAWPIERALAHGERVTDQEVELPRADGSRQVLVCGATPVRDRDGAVATVVATFFDITARRQAEQALRDSEARMRLMVENVREYAMFMLDPEGRVTSWNSGAERLLGWTEAEVLGKPFELFFTPADRSAGLPESEMARARQEGSAVDERYCLRRDGGTLWASNMLAAIRDERGDERGFVKIMRDNTERRQHELRLQEALRTSEDMRALAERNGRAKEDFVSVVSHELRTPLNTIGLWLRLLTVPGVSETDRAAGLRAIERAAAAQRRLIDDLLDTSRMTAGTLCLAARDVSLVDVVDGAVETVRPFAQERGIQIGTTLADDVGVVRIDPDRIRQVVWNLLNNAVKFTPVGGRIDVSVHRTGQAVRIVVADTGIGIAQAFLPQVFDRFRQAEVGVGRPHAGLGLGLAIAKQLVELHGGRIEVASAGEGRGTTFTVTLPLRARPASSGASGPDGPAHDRGELDGIDVLLVEDEDSAREATALLLEGRGGTVRAVGSVSDACRAFESRRPDIVLADIGMPVEDGYTMLSQLRAIEQAAGIPRVPVVALTAFAGGVHRQRALDAGFAEHVSKPVDIDALIGIVRGVVAQR